MAEIILMPRLSDTMTEGIVASWHKKIGDSVKKGDLLAEIETDKATMELESYKDGFLLHLGMDKGGKLQVNDLLAIIGDKNEDISALLKEHKEVKKTTGNQQTVPEVAPTIKPVSSAQNGDERTKASPLARMLAKEKGIDISQIHGTGDGGRIIKADIDSFAPTVQTAEKNVEIIPQQAFSPITGEEGFTDLPNSQIRSIIAKRLSESKFSAPHFYLTMEINMDNAIALRTQLNEVSTLKISFNDFVIKAAALALRQHPAVNSSWMAAPEGTDENGSIRRYHHIHIGIAVAIEDGLIVPVIRFADQKPFEQIATESKELSGRARNKKLQPHEFSGNTFTISNLGMMDIDEFTAIINPPDSCIMAVGKVKEIVVKKPDGFGVANVMKITLSCDHRSVDGATGAAFLQSFKKLLENPVVLFL